MSGSIDAAKKLKTAVLAGYSPLWEAIVDVEACANTIHKADDLMEVLRAVDAYALAAKALGEIATDAKKAVDKVQCAAMHDTGATSFQANGHTVSIRKQPAPLVISDITAVPPQFFTTPSPTLDRDMARKHLQRTDCNWGSLGEPALGLQRKPLT